MATQTNNDYSNIVLSPAFVQDYPNGLRGYVQGVFGNGDHFNQVMIDLQLLVDELYNDSLDWFESHATINEVELLIDFCETF